MIQVCFNTKTIRYISGIKILCSGRWMKTANGRAQSLKYSLGKINSQKINAFLDYGSSTAITSFGSCCLNVIVCYKLIN
jgi:ribosomal protein S3